MGLLKRFRTWWAGQGTTRRIEPRSVVCDEVGVTLRYRFVDDGLVQLTISEEDGGFAQRIAELPIHLDGCLILDDCFSMVASPAFETNLTELYRRA